MFRYLFIIALAFIVSCKAVAQDTTIRYFSQWEEIQDSTHAIYIKKEIKFAENDYEVKLLHSSGDLIYEGRFLSVNPDIENGMVKHYADAGGLIETGYFDRGYPDSTWLVYRPERRTFDTIDYTGVKDFIEDGALGSSFDEHFGNRIEKEPGFPSNEAKVKYDSFSEYVEKEKYFPIMARRKELSGEVFIYFTIGPNGNTHDLNLRNRPSRYFLFETARLIMNSPKWTPGKIGEYKVPKLMNMRIKF